MEYKLNKCPICGSTEIVILSKSNIDGDICYEYVCKACDSVFKSKKPDNKEEYIQNDDQLRPENGTSSDKKDVSAKEIFKTSLNTTVKIYADISDEFASTGSGFILDGFVLTNAHVIHPIHGKVLESYKYYCSFYKSDKNIKLSLLKYDDVLDLAVFKMEEEQGESVIPSLEKVEPGERCYAIGNPRNKGLAITEGIISDNLRYVADLPYIFFSALVQHGNSGGPLFNSKGELIGMVKMEEHGAPSMNYAIPYKAIRTFLKSLR